MPPKSLDQLDQLHELQDLLDRHMPFPNVNLTSFDVPDTSSAAEWPPIIHFERRTLYHREGKGYRAATAWVCDGVIIRATWAGDVVNVPELAGRTLDEVFAIGSERSMRRRNAA